MNDIPTPIENLFEKAEEYGKTTLELIKLKAIDKSAEVLSSLVASLVIFMVIILLVVLSSLGLSLWIGEALGKTYYGFFAVSGFYAVIALLLYLFKSKWIKYPISDSIISQMMK